MEPETVPVDQGAEPSEALKITVKTPANKVISLDVLQTDTIQQVREKIELSEGIAADKQRLLFTPPKYNWMEKKLNNPSTTLAEYDVEDGAELTLYLKVPGEGPMELTVTAITGRSWVVEAEKTDSLATLKMRLEDQCGIPPGQQVLSTKKGKLEDDKMVGDYDLSDGSEVMLYLVLPRF